MFVRYAQRMSERYATYAMAAIMVAAAFLHLYNLGSLPLIDYDEAQYGLITHEIVTDGDWLSPQFRNQPYFEKPPLYFWLAAIAEKIFGQSEFALRIPSAFAGIGLVAAVMLLAHELSRKYWPAALAGAIILTMAPVLETARQTRLDVLVTLCIVLAAYAFVRGLRDSKYFIWFGVAAGLAVMTKSVIAVFAFIAALAFAAALTRGPVPERISFLSRRNFWIGIGVFFLVALPWHVYELVLHGRLFWDVYVGFNIFERTSQALFTLNMTNRDYVWYLANFALPWTQVLVLGAVAVALWRSVDRHTLGIVAACGTVVASVLAIFFASTTKSPTYLVPLYPFAAIAIATASFPVLERWWSGRVRKAVVAAAVGVLLSLGLWSTVYNGFHFNPYYAQADELAHEEKAVGLWLKKHARGETLYAFGLPAQGGEIPMGDVMYYSGNMFPLKLINPPRPGSYIVVPAKAQTALREQYPYVSMDVIFQGKRIHLLQVRALNHGE